MKTIKFIHAADLHLGSVFSGFQHIPEYLYRHLKESGYRALKKLIDTAIEEKVDFVIIAGDIYDLEDRNLKAQLRFRKEMERLNQHHIHVYVIHGNHDYLEGYYYELHLPPNVHVFGRQVEVKLYEKMDGTKVNLYGFSYGSRHIHERVINDYHKQGDADYHIGLLHGNLDGEHAHGNYAPFSKSELLNKQFDYWALGHIHKRMVLFEEPPAIYPGCLQGRNKKETGEKGFYLVSIENMSTNLDFIPAADTEWRTETIELDKLGLTDLEVLIKEIQKRQQQIRQEDKSVLIELVLDASQLKSFDKFTLVNIEDVIESIQEGEEDQEQFVWIHSVKWIPPRHSEAKYGIFGKFVDELIIKTGQLSQEEIYQWGESLLTHTAARKYIDPWDEETWSEIRDGAELELLKNLEK